MQNALGPAAAVFRLGMAYNLSIMKRVSITMALLVLFSPSVLMFASTEGRLTQLTGKVYLRSSELPSEEWLEAEPGMPLQEGDTLRTDQGASAEVTLDGETVVLLQENTELAADSLQGRLTRFFLSL